MTALDNDMAAMRGKLVAALHDQPGIRAVLGVAAITAAVDVAMATAAVRDLVTATANAQVAVNALTSPTPPAPATLDALVADFYDGSDTVRGHYPHAIP